MDLDWAKSPFFFLFCYPSGARWSRSRWFAHDCSHTGRSLTLEEQPMVFRVLRCSRPCGRSLKANRGRRQRARGATLIISAVFTSNRIQFKRLIPFEHTSRENMFQSELSDIIFWDDSFFTHFNFRNQNIKLLRFSAHAQTHVLHTSYGIFRKGLIKYIWLMCRDVWLWFCTLIVFSLS